MNSKFYIANTLYFLIVVERLAMQMHLQGAFFVSGGCQKSKQSAPS